MGLLNDTTPTPRKSRPSSTRTRSSRPSSAPASTGSAEPDALVALKARLEEAEASRDADRKELAALKAQLANLTAPPPPPAALPEAPRGRNPWNPFSR